MEGLAGVCGLKGIRVAKYRLKFEEMECETEGVDSTMGRIMANISLKSTLADLLEKGEGVKLEVWVENYNLNAGGEWVEVSE